MPSLPDFSFEANSRKTKPGPPSFQTLEAKPARADPENETASSPPSVPRTCRRDRLDDKQHEQSPERADPDPGRIKHARPAPDHERRGAGVDDQGERAPEERVQVLD